MKEGESILMETEEAVHPYLPSRVETAKSLFLEKRRKIIDSYLCSEVRLLPEAARITEPLSPKTSVSLVIPAYHEEKTISNLLLALNNQIFRGFEVIVVDNDSRDNTVAIVTETQQQVNYPLYILKEERPGPGEARKTGMDEVLRRVKDRDGEKISPHFIAITDADAGPSHNWLQEIATFIKKGFPCAVGGVHTAPDWIDKVIEAKLAIPHFFARAPSFIHYLNQNNIGQIKLSGPNAAFEIEAYAAGGGMKQPRHPSGQIALREVPQLGEGIRSRGYPILPLVTVIVTSRRRHLLEIIKGKSMYFGDEFSPRKRFITIRVADEDKLLAYALENVSRARWVEYQQKMLKQVIFNTLLYPLISQQIPLDSLATILSPVKIQELRNDLYSKTPEEVINKWWLHFLISLENLMNK